MTTTSDEGDLVPQGGPCNTGTAELPAVMKLLDDAESGVQKQILTGERGDLPAD